MTIEEFLKEDEQSLAEDLKHIFDETVVVEEVYKGYKMGLKKTPTGWFITIDIRVSRPISTSLEAIQEFKMRLRRIDIYGRDHH